MRQLAAYEDKKAELEALGATIYAASVDSLEQAREVVSRGLTFPVAYSTTREESEVFGAWWEGERGFIHNQQSFCSDVVALSSGRCTLLAPWAAWVPTRRYG